MPVRVIVRYPDRIEHAVIEPCAGDMWRISKRKQIHLPRAVRVKQILDALKEEPRTSYGKIGARIGLSHTQVFNIIKEENLPKVNANRLE